MGSVKTVFMFCGQGAQYFQMGRALYDGNGDFRGWMDAMDAVVKEVSGYSVIDFLYREELPKSAPFDRTWLSHPALFMTQYAMARTLMQARVRPDITLGTSLGTFVAAAVCGHVGWEEGLVATLRHAEALQTCCARGVMFAVLGEPRLFEDLGLQRYSELAAINFDSHFVLAAQSASAVGLAARLQATGITFQQLPVEFAFHSRWIDAGRDAFARHLDSMSWVSAQIPMACCARAQLLQTLPKQHLWSATREPILFRDTVRRLESEGAYRYIDMSPAGTLASFVKQVAGRESQSRSHSVLSPFGGELERLAAVSEC
jgi:acyl transferase domain-containing protein